MNLLATVPGSTVSSLPGMDLTGFDLSGDLQVHGHLGEGLGFLNGASFSAANVWLAVRLPEITAAAGDGFQAASLALKLTDFTTTPAATIVGDIRIQIDGQQLTFALDAPIAAGAVSVTGNLTQPTTWSHPFGLSWMQLENVRLTLGTQLGFGADLMLGERQVKLSADVTLSGGVPTSFAFALSSTEGVSLDDLLALMPESSVAIDQLPPMTIADLAIDFEAGTDVLPEDQSMNMAGTLKIDGKSLGDVSGSLGVGSLTLNGTSDNLDVGPLTLSGTEVELIANSGKQQLSVSGEVDLLGSSHSVGVDFGRSSISFTTDTDIAGLYSSHLEVTGDADLSNPNFSAHGEMKSAFKSDMQELMIRALGNELNLKKGEFEILRIGLDLSGLISDRNTKHASLSTINDRVRDFNERVRSAEAEVRFVEKAIGEFLAWLVPDALKSELEKWEGRVRDATRDLNSELDNVPGAQVALDEAEQLVNHAQAQTEEVDRVLANIAALAGDLVALSSVSFTANLQQLINGEDIELQLAGLFMGTEKTLNLAWNFSMDPLTAEVPSAATAAAMDTDAFNSTDLPLVDFEGLDPATRAYLEDRWTVIQEAQARIDDNTKNKTTAWKRIYQAQKMNSLVWSLNPWNLAGGACFSYLGDGDFGFMPCNDAKRDAAHIGDWSLANNQLRSSLNPWGMDGGACFQYTGNGEFGLVSCDEANREPASYGKWLYSEPPNGEDPRQIIADADQEIGTAQTAIDADRGTIEAAQTEISEKLTSLSAAVDSGPDIGRSLNF